ncbi:MAG: transporter substrate-binding domain-containing protein [Pseudomonadales bacterium]|nr:transporter substrate-binding domain-containing protein [Pseudomonadales bacterium]
MQLVYAKPSITLAAPDIGAEQLKKDKKGGYVLVIVTEAFNRLGYDLNFVSFPFERSLKMADSGFVDGELVRSPSIEVQYPNLMRVPERLFSVDLVVVSRSPVDLTTGWSALSGKSVGWLLGVKAIQNHTPESVHLTAAINTTQLFGLLNKKRVDYVLSTRVFGVELLEAKSHGLIVNDEALVTISSYTYLHKKHKQLVPKLAATLAEMKKDGTFQRIIEEYKREGG